MIFDDARTAGVPVEEISMDGSKPTIPGMPGVSMILKCCETLVPTSQGQTIGLIAVEAEKDSPDASLGFGVAASCKDLGPHVVCSRVIDGSTVHSVFMELIAKLAEKSINLLLDVRSAKCMVLPLSDKQG